MSFAFSCKALGYCTMDAECVCARVCVVIHDYHYIMIIVKNGMSCCNESCDIFEI